MVNVKTKGATSVLALFILSRTPVTNTQTSCVNKYLSTLETSSHGKSTMAEKLMNAKEEAIWGMFAADALAMPVHWYYNPSDIKSGYKGWLTGYKAPEKNHPSSIISISSVGGSGRSGWGDKGKPVIGNVILHDKLKYWKSSDRSIHYHQGMRAGDNTLNVLMALQILKTMLRIDPDSRMYHRELRGFVLEDYVKFMTTPGTHNDTYCESFHRSFFKDWIQESEPPKLGRKILSWTEERFNKKSKSSSDSQLVVIGSLVPAIPWIIRNAHKSKSECIEATTEFIKLTHPEQNLVKYVEIYTSLLHGVLNGNDLKQEALKVLESPELGGPGKREMVLKLLRNSEGYQRGTEERLKTYQTATGKLGSACYIDGALSSLLFLAIEFADDVNGGILANANCGGENCHRGAALGALLGAAAAYRNMTVSENLKDGLGSAKSDLIKVLEKIRAHKIL